MRILVLFLTFFLFHNSAQAEIKSLSEKNVIDAATKHYPQIIAAEAKVEVEDQRLRKARGAFDSKLSGNYGGFNSGRYEGSSFFDSRVSKPFSFANSEIYAGYSKSVDDYPELLDYYQTNNGGKLKLGGQFSLLRNLLTNEGQANIDITRQSREIAQNMLNLKKMRVSADARKSFWRFVIYKKIYEVYQNLYEVAVARDKLLTKQAAHGDIPKIYVTENKRNILNRLSALATYERILKEYAINLAFYYRDENGNMIDSEEILKAKINQSDKPPFSPNQKDLKNDIANSTSDRIDVRIAKLSINQTQTKLNLAKNNLLPELNLGGEVSQNQGNGIRSDKSSSKVFLNFEVPIQTNKQQGDIGENKAKLTELRSDLKLIQDQVENEIKSIYNKITEAQILYKNSVKEVELNKILENGEKKRFAGGDAELFMVNYREQDTAFATEKSLKNELLLIELNTEYQFATQAF